MAATLETLLLDNLKLRGLGETFNGFSRFFASLDDAETSLATGDYVPVPGELNAVIVGGEGIMVYSFELLTFVLIEELAAADNQASKYIDLDGVNDYIEFTTVESSANNVMDLNHDWSVGVTLVGVTAPAAATNMTLFSRGGFHITLKAQQGSSNWGLYVTSDNNLYDAATRAQANTWYAPSDFSRILFTYCSATQRLRYYLGDPSTGVFAQRANLYIPTSMITGQNIGGSVCLGKDWTGTGGSYFSGFNWHGGLNNFIASDIEMLGPQLTEYFQTQATNPDNPSESFEGAEFYPDLVSHAKLGEDVYPEVVDQIGGLTGGSLVNGAPDDFKDVPSV